MRLGPFCGAIAIGLIPRSGVFTFAGQAAGDPSIMNIAVAGLIIAAAIAITWRLRLSFRAP